MSAKSEYECESLNRESIIVVVMEVVEVIVILSSVFKS